MPSPTERILFKLVDIGSQNGTFVRGHKIKQYALKDNDVIDLGDCKIEYLAGDNINAWFYDIDGTDAFTTDDPASMSLQGQMPTDNSRRSDLDHRQR